MEILNLLNNWFIWTLVALAIASIVGRPINVLLIVFGMVLSKVVYLILYVPEIILMLYKVIGKPKSERFAEFDNWAKNSEHALDQTANAAFAHLWNAILLKNATNPHFTKYGDMDQTISYVTGIAEKEDNLSGFGKWFAAALNFIFRMIWKLSKGRKGQEHHTSWATNNEQ